MERVAALCSSDEETEDMSSLQFLPISPEVEDPEDGALTSGVPVSGTGGQDSDKQRSKENDSPTPAKKRKYKSFEIKLEGAPKDGKDSSLIMIGLIHILLNVFFCVLFSPSFLLQIRNSSTYK